MRGLLQRHQPFLVLFFLFATFRLMAILLLRPGGDLAYISDYEVYRTWGQLGPMGYRTFVDTWSVYPPLFPALMLPLFEWASRIPPWVEPGLFFNLFFGFEMLGFECGVFVLIYRLAHRLAPDSASNPPLLTPVSAPVIYALLFTPFYTLLGWFEAMPLFFLLLALDRLLAAPRGWIASAVAVGLGFLTKLVPLILVPVAIRWLGGKLSWSAARREWFNPRSPGNLLRPTLYTLIFLGMVGGLGYWLVGGNLALAFSSLQANTIRPPWQNLWAILEGYYTYGIVPDIRNLGSLQQAQWESRLPWGAITLGFGVVYLWLYTRPYDWSQPRTPITFTGISIIWLFLYSKGWSPQFLLWILAFLVLLQPTWRGILFATFLTLINIVESAIYLVLLPDQHWLLIGTVLTRTLLLLLLMAEWLGQIWPTVVHGQRLQRISQRFATGVMVLALISLIAATPRMAQAYTARRWAEHPCQATITYLQANTTAPNRLIVTDQIELWQQLYPWLRQDYTLRVVDGYNTLDRPWPEVAAERLVDFVGQREFWWVDQPDLPPSPSELSPVPGTLLDAQTLGACTIERRIQLAAMPLAVARPAADEQIALRAADWGTAQVGADFDLVLYWQAATAVTGRYTVFTQLLNEVGQVVAQQDNLPVGGLAPTDLWQPETLIRDPYRLALPPDLPPGAYRLIVGMYNEAGRLTWQTSAGQGTDHVAFDVQVTAD